MIDTLALYFLLFIIYSFLGWGMEMVYCYYCTKKWVDRGFLIGPICPIYGVGCLGISILLNKYYDDPIVLFLTTAFVCSLLEYFTSYIMEKLFKARWWDYSDKKYNINGRICLEIIGAFGVLGLLLTNEIHPFIMNILGHIDSSFLNFIALVIFAIFVVDIAVSVKIISGFKSVAKSVRKDSTEEITKKIREKLMKQGGLYKRLVNAFNFEASEKLLKEVRQRIKETTSKAKDKIDKQIKKKKTK